MRLFITALAAVALAAPAFAAAPHPCADDAKARAASLLKWYWNTDTDKLADQPGAPVDGGDMAWDIRDEVTQLPAVKPSGSGEAYDVLEVYAYVYKATFRIHLLYAQVPGECVLNGAEILGE